MLCYVEFFDAHLKKWRDKRMKATAEKNVGRHARVNKKKEKNLCKKHSLSHNVDGAMEAILQRRHDKHSVNNLQRKMQGKSRLQ